VATTTWSVVSSASAPTSSGCSVGSSPLGALFGDASIVELHGGRQARVFRVTGTDGSVVVAKLTDASLVDRVEFTTRVEVVAALADLDARVCRPLPLDHRLITEVDVGVNRHLLVCYQHADGQSLDARDGDLMGRTLRGLHASMAELPVAALPMVAALRDTDGGDMQLLHGDFNAGNMRRQGAAVRIFDFDDCGYGPPAFDVANALYMVLFDAVVNDAHQAYVDFRSAFLGGYHAGCGAGIADDVLDGFIDRRVAALQGWLDDLDHAPIGIRTASPEWRATLRSFVTTYRDAN